MNRQGFIGGSDARRIMEGDWHTLWLEKTGRAESADLSENIAVQLGAYTEQFNIMWFKRHHFVNSFERNSIDIIEQVQFKEDVNGVPCKGTVDGCIRDQKRILECKHTYDRNTMESCIGQYMPQIQFYMRLTDAEHCYLSVIFGNRRWEAVAVARDDRYIDAMMVHIAEFWKCVTSDTEPAVGKRPTTLTTDHIPVDNMVRRDATGDNEFINRVHDYIESEGMAKSFESAKSDLKAMVADNEREVYCDLLTIKRDKRGSLRISVKENTDG
jgi:predicted phage-related endonuclease